MRYLFILPLTSLVPAVISAQEAMPPTTTMTKTPCASSFGYDGVDQMKSNLLLQAKRAAVNELFGEFITAVTQVKNFAVTRDQIQALSAGFVRVRRVTYDHGPNLGDVCVTITAYTTAEDRAKFVPENIEKRNCVSDATMSVGQLRRYAQEEIQRCSELAQAILWHVQQKQPDVIQERLDELEQSIQEMQALLTRWQAMTV